MAGNSEGFVLLFQNIGSNEQPKFLPATRVQAGGPDIQVQAGYSGGGDGPNLLICNEAGRMFLIPGKRLRTKP